MPQTVHEAADEIIETLGLEERVINLSKCSFNV
jgi:hypothetical protein